MKKPSRKQKPHKGSRKGPARKAARQARRASLAACDHHGPSLASPQPRNRDASSPIPAFGLDLTRPVLPAILGLARTSARTHRHAFLHKLPVAFAPKVWARALQFPAFEDREALAFLSLPLLALSLMLALGLLEFGRHSHPLYRGLELASAARPAALPRTPGPIIQQVAGTPPSTVTPVPGIVVIAAAGPPPSLAAQLSRPVSVAETTLTGTLASLAPVLAAEVKSPIMPKSRLPAPEIASNGAPPADVPAAPATAPPFAPVPLASLLASEDPSAITNLAATTQVLPEPSYPAPHAAEPLAEPVALPELTDAPGLLATRFEAPPFAPDAPVSAPVESAPARLALLSLAPPVADIALISPLLASLYARDEPGSGPQLCAASSPAPRPVRQSLAPAAFGQALADAALGQTADLVIYNDTYRHLSYPWGDVSPLYGVCTDVVIRAYRALGVDLQQLVHESALGSGDTSIEHRRVETLRRFFTRYGDSLPITAVAEDYLPGDVVTYYRPQNRHSKTHIAVVSNEVGPSGRYKIIHNRGWGPQSEDALFVDEITGHYRYWTPPATPAPLVTATEAKPAAPVSPRLLRTATSRLRTDGLPARGLGH